MKILNSDHRDVSEIFRLYKVATDLQRTKSGATVWPEFDPELIKTEINENRQWKMIIDEKIACVWAITFSDPQIWEERNNDPAVYIHRIATEPAFRGQNLVMAIVDWAETYALENNKRFVRLDTVGENLGLINYYQKCGFIFLGLFPLKDTAGLPAHYNNASVSLFEIDIKAPAAAAQPH